ncbi:aminoglycoside phosphotransferase family protein [Candidatus Protochlamydia phocaeensis]|uniref:aminoglycoside phosphotransferase family protein n=1 Tax=Candidatus Protochlamydia phocaeensis TaxID=1414722 RepID=UPI000838C8E0|nr:aminoglycoside phosphotransferase family protein [Candidatus Protochlamydia phocaeensis]
MTDAQQIIINDRLVSRLVATQFPQWKNFPIRPVKQSGWDNRTFHLGRHLLVRMPSAAEYAGQVEKEWLWLPKLAPFLPLPLPVPLAIGEPAYGYPWKWSIYRWIEGESATCATIANLPEFATRLAQFLFALQHIETMNAPLPGPHSFYRGGTLTIYDTETRRAIDILKKQIDSHAATAVWEAALATEWKGSPVWVHGDISMGNLLVQEGRLCAIIDFGQLTIGDPACDLAIAWTLFKGESRQAFQAGLPLDAGTWKRGRAWALWKALIIAAGLAETNAVEGTRCWHSINEVLKDCPR